MDAHEIICAAADERLGLAPGTFRQDVDRRMQEYEQEAAGLRIAGLVLQMRALAEEPDNDLARFLRAAARIVQRRPDLAMEIGAAMTEGNER